MMFLITSSSVMPNCCGFFHPPPGQTHDCLIWTPAKRSERKTDESDGPDATQLLGRKRCALAQSNFDPDEFAETLVKANVNSITCFARCHHGWLYFDTRAFPERKHPHLQKELLPRQIQACHQRVIRVPI